MAEGGGQIGRSILAVLAGAVVAFVLVFVVEAVGRTVYPAPAGVDFSNPEAVKAIMQQMPAGALGFVLLAWLTAAFGGGWVAARIAPRSPVTHALIVGGLLLAATIANLVMIPHPLWMSVGGVAGIPLCAYLGSRLVRRSTPA